MFQAKATSSYEAWRRRMAEASLTEMSHTDIATLLSRLGIKPMVSSWLQVYVSRKQGGLAHTKRTQHRQWPCCSLIYSRAILSSSLNGHVLKNLSREALLQLCPVRCYSVPLRGCRHGPFAEKQAPILPT